MLYLSKGEQAALVLLLVLLLAGAGTLTYRRGVAAGRAQVEGPLFVDAAASPPAGRPAGAGAPRSPAAAAPATFVPSCASPAPPKEAASAASGRISLNAATLAQLESLPGIGPVYAQRIIDYRKRLRREQGRGFTSVDELLNVSGIGTKRFAALRDRVVP